MTKSYLNIWHNVPIGLHEKGFLGRMITLDIDKINQIRSWLEQNKINDWQYDGSTTIRFKNQNDAILFKLAWS